jgi:hypothetical protein
MAVDMNIGKRGTFGRVVKIDAYSCGKLDEHLCLGAPFTTPTFPRSAFFA